jgi:hypothetical protein
MISLAPVPAFLSQEVRHIHNGPLEISRDNQSPLKRIANDQADVNLRRPSLQLERFQVFSIRQKQAELDFPRDNLNSHSNATEESARHKAEDLSIRDGTKSRPGCSRLSLGSRPELDFQRDIGFCFSHLSFETGGFLPTIFLSLPLSDLNFDHFTIQFRSNQKRFPQMIGLPFS